MNIIDIKCPRCDGDLHIQEGRKEVYCEFCGAHLFFDDGSMTFTTVNIYRDEARIKEAEVDLKKAETDAEIERARAEHEALIAKAKADKILQVEKIKARTAAKVELKKAKIEARKESGVSPLRTVLKIIWIASLFIVLTCGAWERTFDKYMPVEAKRVAAYLLLFFIVISIYLLITHKRKK